jgi:hypothetical protein
LNKPFKSFVRGAWEDYMMRMAQASREHIPTASKDEIVQWIINANACLNEQGSMISKAFLVCGISNHINGSENHFIRVAEELPNFVIPYGSGQDEESDDPFETSDEESEGDADSTDSS